MPHPLQFSMLGPIGSFILGRNSWQELRIANKKCSSIRLVEEDQQELSSSHSRRHSTIIDLVNERHYSAEANLAMRLGHVVIPQLASDEKKSLGLKNLRHGICLPTLTRS